MFQPNCTASTQRVLNLRDGVGCPNQNINFRLRRVGMHENPVTNVGGWLAGIPKGGRHFYARFFKPLETAYESGEAMF